MAVQIPAIPVAPAVCQLGSWIWSPGSAPKIKQATVTVVTNRSTLIAPRAPANLSEALSAQITALLIKPEPSPLMVKPLSFPGSESHPGFRQKL